MSKDRIQDIYMVIGWVVIMFLLFGIPILSMAGITFQDVVNYITP